MNKNESKTKTKPYWLPPYNKSTTSPKNLIDPQNLTQNIFLPSIKQSQNIPIEIQIITWNNGKNINQKKKSF
jgi:hypothetical protein